MSDMGVAKMGSKMLKPWYIETTLDSNIFRNEEEQNAYLIKELKNTNKKIEILQWQTSRLKTENRQLKEMFTDSMRNFNCKDSEDNPKSEYKSLKLENLRLKQELLLKSSEIFQLLLKTASHPM
eukprot:TRINITY_DN11398_c0_g1_i1.p1 TRINITY_DN11398_c0_g1~~TRINITY_DN11398_c0_g1_i1.p1  ORF type:complete len:124 (-),score=28.14 TRINITY_DN11398_c0_g1_i1:332-703(-)